MKTLSFPSERIPRSAISHHRHDSFSLPRRLVAHGTGTFPGCFRSWTVIAITLLLLLPLGGNAATIFQDNVSAISGGTRALGATSSIQTVSPLAPGTSDSYLNSSIAAGAGSTTIVTYTPSGPSNSWSALVGVPLNIGGVNYLNLNGAFDLFVRPNQTEAGTSWFRPVDVSAISGSTGMRIILAGTQVQILTASGTNALGNAPNSFTTNNSLSLNSPIGNFPTYLLTGSIVHLGFTFNTNAATGQITVKVFATPNIAAIDTSSNTVGQGNLLAMQTFYASATLIGSTVLPSGAWIMKALPRSGTFEAATKVDYDTIRLYDSDPGNFAALGTYTAPPLPTQNLDIAPMTWSSGRSDWINVKSAPYNAVGNGVADDTAALQSAFNAATVSSSFPKTVYLPPGTYRITQTLYWHTPVAGWGGGSGLALIGSGGDPGTRSYTTRGTRILWAGPAGQPMLASTGVTRTRYMGIVWDGAGTAQSAYSHNSTTLYETEIRHENEAFLNFSAAGACGIYSGDASATVATAETMVWNCLFYNCTTGATVGAALFNYYMWTFDGCEFEGCGTGINSPDGKCVVMNTHFSGSTVADITASQATRVRHCTSTGSFMFFKGGVSGAGFLFVIQDCLIDSWANPGGAMTFGDRGPNNVFDCTFTNPRNGTPPIYTNGSSTVPTDLLLSQNYVSSGAALVGALGTNTVNQVTVPNGGRVSSLTSASQTFLQSTWPADGPIIDVVTSYGANPNYGVTDNTTAITNAIAAAKAANNGSIVYLPSGGYKISSTLALTGSNYSVQGSGVRTQVLWYGPANGSLITVADPQNLALRQMDLKIQNTATAVITQTGTGASSMTYDGIYEYAFSTSNPGADLYNLDGPGVVLAGLPAGSTVYIPNLAAPLTIQDSGPATILGKFLNVGQVNISGATQPKSGFLGTAVLELLQNVPGNWSLTVNDNQNLVIGDYYSEQSYNDMQFLGGAGTTPGKFAVQFFKSECNSPSTQISINNYQGNIFHGNGWMPANFNSATITQTGTNACTLTLEGINFSDGVPNISVQPSCTLSELLNTTFTSTSTVYNANVQPVGWDTAAAAGFDYLRELGSMTLAMRYSISQAVSNTSAELDAANPNPATALGFVPAGWTLSGAAALGGGIRNVTTVAGASPFGAGSQSMLVVDNTGSASGAALELAQTFSPPFAPNQPGALSFDFRLNAAGTGNNLLIRPWAGTGAGCTVRLNSGQISALVNGVDTPLAAVTAGTWYRVQVSMGPPAAGPVTATLYLTPWAGTGIGATNSYVIDSFGAVQSSGFDHVTVDTSAPGASENINLDNITLNSGLGLFPNSNLLPILTGLNPAPGGNAGQILVQWNAVPGASTYTVMRSNSAGSGYAVIATVNAPATSYTDSDPALLAGQTYYYRVSASNSTGTAPTGSGAGATPFVPPGIVGWRYTHFGAAGLNPTVANGAADAANPTSDGFNNLLKYALGMDPAVRYSHDSPLAPAGAIQSFSGTRYLTLTFDGTASDLIYAVDFSGDLSTWQTLYNSSGTSAPGNVMVQDNQPAATAPRRFVRLRITGP